MTPGLPFGPHPSNAFAFAPGFPSFGLPSFFPLDSRNLATPCLGREPKARVATSSNNHIKDYECIVEGWEANKGGYAQKAFKLWSKCSECVSRWEKKNDQTNQGFLGTLFHRCALCSS